MKIVRSYPPNIDDIQKVFGILPSSVIYTYGDTIYAPGEGEIPWHLMKHEETHMRQQGDNPGAWWKRYLSDDGFRLYQEVEAYRNQFNSFRSKIKDRGKVFEFAQKIARDLSGHIYGHITTFSEAYVKITGGQHD